MAWQDYIDTVQKVYIAYYQRPGDPAGIRYWAQRLDVQGGDLAAIIDAFANSAESQALYGPIDQTTIGNVIDSIYQALFGRLPDAAGKQWYIDQFTSGQMTAGQIALSILNGARNDDLVAIQNKLQVANTFSQLVDGDALTSQDFGVGPFQATYGGDADAQQARDMLRGVLSNPSTLLTADQIRNFLQQHIADPGDPILNTTSGKTYTLTNGADVYVGTNANDIFDGSLNPQGNVTFQSFDKLDGGQGDNDTLIAQGIGNITTTPDTIKNIETIRIVGAIAASTLNLVNTTGVKTIIEDSPVAKHTVANIAAGIQRIDVINPGGTQTFTFQTDAVKGTKDSLTVGLSTIPTTRNVVLAPVSGTNGFETLNIELSGGQVKANINDGASTTLSTVNISGSSKASINLAGPATATTVDASKTTGGVTLNVTYAKDITITGGSGNDTFIFGNSFNTKDVVNGGDGVDTLAANAAQFAAFTTKATNISNIETIWVQTAIAGNTIDVSLFGVKSVLLGNSPTATAGTLNKLASGSTVSFSQDANVNLNVDNAANGKADTLSLVSLQTAATATLNLTIPDVETINFNGGDNGNWATLTLTANDAAAKGYGLTVNLTGADPLVLNLISNHATNVVDGSAMTGTLKADLTNVTKGPATLKGGSAGDVLTGGWGADTITGGGGADKFVFNNFGAADTITDFTATKDRIYINAASKNFNATTAPNGIKVGGILKIWNTMGVNVTMLTMAVPWTTTGAAVTFMATTLFNAANKAALTAAVKAAVKGNPDARGVAFGRVGTILYAVYVNDTMPAATNSGTAIQAVRTIAKVGAGFTASDIYLF